jgi:hypothetical protein
MNKDSYSAELDKLGQFFMHQIRDVCIGRLEGIFDQSKSFSPTDRKFRESVSRFDDNEIQLIKDIVATCIDSTISELLYSFESDDDELKGIQMAANGTDIRELGSSLQVLMHSEWLERFSKYGEEVTSRKK